MLFRSADALVTTDDRHVLVNNNGVHIAKLQDAGFDFLKFVVSGFELFSRIIAGRD